MSSVQKEGEAAPLSEHDLGCERAVAVEQDIVQNVIGNCCGCLPFGVFKHVVDKECSVLHLYVTMGLSLTRVAGHNPKEANTSTQLTTLIPAGRVHTN